jgi:hypothetical protein
MRITWEKAERDKRGFAEKNERRRKKGTRWRGLLLSPFFVSLGHKGSFCFFRNSCGNLKNRREILELLQTLCTCPVATHEEVLTFLEANHLMGRGLHYIDLHLLASAKLSGIPLWTLDRPLITAASRVNVAHGSD